MKAFISYCGNDGRELARRLVKILERTGAAEIWFYDDSKYIVGEIPWVEIYSEIMKKEWMIVLTTENTHININQKNEYMNAIMNGKRTFSFTKMGSTIPDELKGRNAGFFDDANFEDACSRFVLDIQKVEGSSQRIRFGDELIERLRAGTNGLNLNKIKQLRKEILDRYLAQTEIRNIARISLLPDGSKISLEGQYIWWEDDLKQFQREDIYYGVICFQIADTITNGELSHLIQTLIKYSTNRHIVESLDPNLKYYKIREQINLLTNKGFELDFMMLPVQNYSEFMNYLPSMEIDDVRWEKDGKAMLYFKNKAVIKVYSFVPTEPTVQIIIGSSNNVRCTIRSDKEDGALATAIGVSPLYKDKVDFFARTLYKLEILKPEAIAVITLV
jgi:hypothetical protein